MTIFAVVQIHLYVCKHNISNLKRGEGMSKEERQALISTGEVEKLMLNIRGKDVLLDRDVAMLYGVETRIVNQAVRNNPEKFPQDYIIVLNEDESSILRSKILTLEQKTGKGRHSKYNIKAFTERGLYMLATILKSPRAIDATLAIIDTFTMTRQLSRTMESIQKVEDGGEQQRGLLQKTGEILADIVGGNLSTANTETEIEFNFAIVKIKHKIIRDKE